VTGIRVVLATHNAHKVREFQSIIAHRLPGVLVESYDGPEPVENGVTFAENALIKARAAAEHTGLIALADDSGICVDVLGGAPGIFSARWAGRHGGDGANLRLLLDQLSDIDDPHRGAHFACTIALVRPLGAGLGVAVERTVDGLWPGRLAHGSRGENGFGYDPIFVPDGETVTSAELAPERKNAMSHRARAFERMIPVLGEFTRGARTS
jgi:non-canonical purine NTP pyrophosphatase, rdgB/HAM1 family